MRLTPILPLAFALALGEAAALSVPFAPALAPWLYGAIALVILFGYGWSVPGWGYLATALLGFAVAGSSLGERRNLLGAAARTRGPFVCEATVREPARVRGEWVSSDVTVSGLNLRVIFPKGEAVPQAGDVWRFAGWLERRPTDAFRRKLWVRGAGTEAVRVTAAEPWSPTALAARLKADLSRRLGIGLDHAPDIANFNRAILLGERRGVDRETRAAFAAAGTTHIFAISGLHVMCVAGILYAVLIACGMPVRAIPFVLVPVLWGYVFLVGGSPSAVRAAAMATIYLFAPTCWRRPDGLVAWSLVFIAVHLLNPLQLQQVGSCLSFAVMLTLILFGRWYREVVPSGRGEILAMSLATWAAGVPIVAVVFGRFTPGAVLANIVLLPVAGVTVLMSAVAVGASFVSAALAAYCNNAAALATNALVGVSRLTAALPGASVEVPAWTPWHCFAWYFVLILTLYLVRSVVLRRRSAP